MKPGTSWVGAAVALLLATACAAGQDRRAEDAFEAYIACDASAARAETAAEFLACHAAGSAMASVPESAVLDILRNGPEPMTDRKLVEASADGDTIQLRIRGRLGGTPAAELVRMRIEGGDWRIVDARTRVYAGAVTSVADDRPLTFALTIDGESMLTEENAVVTAMNTGFPSFHVAPLFADEPAFQIDNLRLETEAQAFEARPSNVILADPALVSAHVRSEAIPIRHDLRGELTFSARDDRAGSGKIRLLVADLLMDEPIEIVFTFENLPLPQ